MIIFDIGCGCDGVCSSGRNVCRYYLIGACKFGDRCSYLHSKEYLLQQGWWSTIEGIEGEKRRYDMIQMCNKAIGDYKNQMKPSKGGQTSKKKTPKGKKKGGYPSPSGLGGSRSGVSPSEIGQSSQKIGTKNKKKPTAYSYSRWEGYDSDGDDEGGMCRFTGSQVEELMSQGVKPWDDDAWVRCTRFGVHHTCLRFP